MTFTRLTPQLVEHSDGYQVGSAGREHFRYRSAEDEALIGTDRPGNGPDPLYIDRVEWTAPKARPATAAEAALIVNRVTAGLAALDIRVEHLRADAPPAGPFVRLSPQEVEHELGFRVVVASRHHIAYVEGSQRAEVAADVGGRTVDLFVDRVRWTGPTGRPASTAEARLIVDRVVQALGFMQMPHAIHRGEVISEE